MWLKRAGYAVTTADSPPALAKALSVTPYGLRLMDSKLLVGLERCTAPPKLEDATPGFLWLEPHTVRPLIPSGRGTAVNCPRPHSSATFETLLRYVLHPETTRLLDAALVGEILGMSPTALAAETLVDRFTEEVSMLANAMRHAHAPTHRAAWYEAHHALQGCAAAIGAVGLVGIVADFEVEDWSATPRTAVASLEEAITATEHSLRRAVGAYFAA